MEQALSIYLRSRILAALDDGMSCRGAASRFGVAPSTAIRLQAQRHETGSFAPKPQGGDTRSRGVGGNRPERLCGRASSLLRAPRHDTQKKTAHAIEQSRPDVLKQHHDWFDGQIDLEPQRLIFIDDDPKLPVVRGYWRGSTATNMTRSHAVMVAPMVLDGPINGNWFVAYVTNVLVPDLHPDDIVIMDNLSSEKSARCAN